MVRHVGGGWYEASNGSRHRGREAAEAAEAALAAGGGANAAETGEETPAELTEAERLRMGEEAVVEAKAEEAVGDEAPEVEPPDDAAHPGIDHSLVRGRTADNVQVHVCRREGCEYSRRRL